MGVRADRVSGLYISALQRFKASRIQVPRPLQNGLALTPMNWLQLALELAREAMKPGAEPAKPAAPTDLARALSEQFALIDRNMDAIVRDLAAHNANLERTVRRQRIWNYALAAGVVIAALVAFLR
jgi:hypothetical protein